MDENASKAVFIGVSVFVAMLTITLILTFYRTAKTSAASANQFDITVSGNVELRDILQKDKIKGVELRYLLNYFEDEDTVEIDIINQSLLNIVDNPIGDSTNINNSSNWLGANYQSLIEKNIRPNYNYRIDVQETTKGFGVKATFLY